MTSLIPVLHLPTPVVEIVEGELVEQMAQCPACQFRHPVIGGLLQCCCGTEHEVEFCCACGHFHSLSEPCRPAGPCGNYQCCIN